MDKAKYVTLALVAVVLSTSLMIPSVDAEESDYTEGRFFYNQLTAQEKRYYNDLSNASVGKKITCYDLDSFQKALYAHQSEPKFGTSFLNFRWRSKADAGSPRNNGGFSGSGGRDRSPGPPRSR